MGRLADARVRASRRARRQPGNRQAGTLGGGEALVWRDTALGGTREPKFGRGCSGPRSGRRRFEYRPTRPAAEAESVAAAAAEEEESAAAGPGSLVPTSDDPARGRRLSSSSSSAPE